VRIIRLKWKINGFSRETPRPFGTPLLREEVFLSIILLPFEILIFFILILLGGKKVTTPTVKK